jgi:hypothetical protein
VDIEAGAATPASAPDWVMRAIDQHGLRCVQFWERDGSGESRTGALN